MESAQEDFETALESAKKLGHQETLWQIHHHLGKLLLSQRDVERGYQHLRSAGAALKRLSQNIKDQTMKQSYLNDPRKRDLLLDLQEAARELVGETRIT